MLIHNILTDDELARLFDQFKDSGNTFIQKVVKAVPDTLYVLNLDSLEIIYSSRSIASEMGYSTEEVANLAHPILSIMHPMDKELFLSHLQDVKNSLPSQVLTVEYRLIRHNGKIAWFIDRDTIFTRNTQGVAVTKIGTTHEITKRKELELVRIEHELIMDETEKIADSGSWVYNQTSGSFTWSPGMYRLFNLPQGVKVHPSIYSDYSTEEDQEIANRIVGYIENDYQSFEETLHIAVDGNIRVLRIKAEPLLHKKVEEKKLVGVDLNITLLKEKEEQLKTLNKDLEKKNQHITSLHLDLKTIADITAADYHANIKSVYSSFETIINHEASNLSNNAKAVLRKTQAVLQRMNLLTNDVVSYLSITDLKKIERISLDAIIDRLIQHLRERMPERSFSIIKQPLGSITGDEDLIYILFRNIIDNAIKFAKQNENPEIYITSEFEKSEPPGQGFLAVHIEDKGIGLEETENIFNLFYKNHYSRKLRGSGVGLAVARKIMNIHEGRIVAESSPSGSKFTVYFPEHLL